MQPPPLQIADTPNTHGMFILGTTTLYLCHMPMFWKEDHRYQMTLQVHLDPASMAVFVADKLLFQGEAYNLINPQSEPFTLPEIANGTITTFNATVYRGYSNEDDGTPGPQIISNATVFIDRVVRYRPFTDSIPPPSQMTYVLFGDGQEAHLDHYMSQEPDFQHLLTLPEVPTWLPTSQLRAGVEVSLPGLASTPISCQNPLTQTSYSVTFEGIPSLSVPLQVGASATVWFSTGNMLNSQDPCSGGTELAEK